MLSILLAISVILIGMYAFDEQKCLDSWFADDKLCKECAIEYGDSCMGCNETRCDNCTLGYFMVVQNDTVRGIDVANETQCRTCASFFGDYCIDCNQTHCLQGAENSTYVDDTGVVIDCKATFGDFCEICSADTCT